MKYYKYDDDNLFDNGVTFYEVDGDCAMRSLTVDGEEWAASNVKHPRWGLSLPDQCGNFDEFEEYIPILKREFDEVWNRHLERRHDWWQRVKNDYPVGKAIGGAINRFYPQGVLVDLENGALGIADYALCYASAKPEWMYPEHQIKAIVSGYDEENQWIQLYNARVLATTTRRFRQHQVL